MLWIPISSIMEPVSHVLVCQIPAVPVRSEQKSQQGHRNLSAGQLQLSTTSYSLSVENLVKENACS